MIVGIEGLSQAGKSKFIEKFIEKYPSAIRFRGAGSVNVGIQSRWQEYNFWMHNIIEQLDKLNSSKNIILWDRFLTDAVHSEDPLYRSEILRAIKSHSKKCLIYIDVPDLILKKRGSKEGDELDSHRKRYESVIKSFDTLTLSPGKREYNDYLSKKDRDIKQSIEESYTADNSLFYLNDEHLIKASEFIHLQMKK